MVAVPVSRNEKFLTHYSSELVTKEDIARLYEESPASLKEYFELPEGGIFKGFIPTYASARSLVILTNKHLQSKDSSPEEVAKKEQFMKRRDWWLVKSTLPERMLYAYLMLTADDNPKFDLTERQIHVLVGLYVLSPRFLSPAQYSDEILVKHPPINQKDTGLIIEEEALSRFKQEESTWLQVLESTGGSIVVVFCLLNC